MKYVYFFWSYRVPDFALRRFYICDGGGGRLRRGASATATCHKGEAERERGKKRIGKPNTRNQGQS